MKKPKSYFPLLALALAATAQAADPPPKLRLPKFEPTVVPVPVKAARDAVDPNIALINPAAMWRKSKGEGVILFVSDTGIDAAHPEFAGHKVTLKNFTTSPDADVARHGTHVAGTAVGRRSVDGLAPDVDEVVALKVLGDNGSGDFDWLRKSILYAREYCKAKGKPGVFTASLGGGADPKADPRAVTPDLRKAIAGGIEEGMIFLFAAGNDDSTLPPNSVGFPARYAEIPGPLADLIVVSACDVNRRIAPFSSVGPATRVTVVGVKVLGPLPGGQYGEWDGTSMATPILAGVTCNWMSVYHKSVAPKDRQRVFAEMLRKASSFPDQRHPARGYGLPDCEKLFAAVPVPQPPIPPVPPPGDGFTGTERRQYRDGRLIGVTLTPDPVAPAVAPRPIPAAPSPLPQFRPQPIPGYWVPPIAQPWYQPIPQSVPQWMPRACPPGGCPVPIYR